MIKAKLRNWRKITATRFLYNSVRILSVVVFSFFFLAETTTMMSRCIAFSKTKPTYILSEQHLILKDTAAYNGSPFTWESTDGSSEQAKVYKKSSLYLLGDEKWGRQFNKQIITVAQGETYRKSLYRKNSPGTIPLDKAPPPRHSTDGAYTTAKPFAIETTGKGKEVIYLWLADKAGNTNHHKKDSVAFYNDITPPDVPIKLTVSPGKWTNVNSFRIDWENPSDPSGIAGIYYKLGAPPRSNTDGTYTTEKPFYIKATAEGGQIVYTWLKDEAGNADCKNRAFSNLFYDITSPDAPVDSTASPSTWTATNSFQIDWTNPSDSSGVFAAYYKLGNPPTHNTDGIYTTDKPFTVEATAGGGQVLYTWLVDRARNIEKSKNSYTVLYFDKTASDGRLAVSEAPPDLADVQDPEQGRKNSTDSSKAIEDIHKQEASPGSNAEKTYNTHNHLRVEATAQEEQDVQSVLIDESHSPNLENKTSSAFFYDITPPDAPIGIAASPSTWTATNSFQIDWTNPSDPTKIVGAYYKLGSSPESHTDGRYTTEKPFTVYATAEGRQDIFVWLVDGNGNTDYMNRVFTTIHYDSIKPTNGSVSINNDEVDSESTLVTLIMSSYDFESGLSQMMISEDLDFTDSSWEDFVTRKSFPLSKGDGKRTVYVKFRDKAGNESAPVSDSILLMPPGQKKALFYFLAFGLLLKMIP